MNQSLMSKDRSVLSRTVKTLLLGLAAASLPLTAATAANIEIGNATLTTTPGTLYVNGVAAGSMASARIDPSTGHIEVTGDMSVGDGGGDGGPGGDPEDPPPVDPPPVDPPPSGSCEKWAALGSRTLAPSVGKRYPNGSYDLGGEVKSFQFDARQGNGTLNVVHASGVTKAMKTIWVSHCPGGEPVHSRYMINQGSDSANIGYTGGAEERLWYLEAGQTYYFNVVNAYQGNPAVNTCTRNCPMVPALR